MAVYCTSYCSHGGRCVRDPGHEGVHDSGYCTWTDAEALTRQQADAVIAGKPGGQEFLDFGAPVADLLEEIISEDDDQ